MSGGIWIYGSVPEPLGGVSVFVDRLIRSGRIAVDGLVDPYFGRKAAIAPLHLTPRRPGWGGRLATIAALWRLRTKPLFVNGSRSHGLFLLAPLLLLRRAPTALLLHHGDLGSPERMSFVRRRLLSRILASFDAIGWLNEAQARFYEDMGVDGQRLEHVDIHLPHAPSMPVEQDGLLRSTLAWMADAAQPVAVGSGSGKAYYRNDWPIDALDRGGAAPGFSYVLCAYGPPSDTRAALRRRMAGRTDCLLVEGLDPAQFDVVLGACDLFLRPTDVESVGLSALDAAAKGKAVVASDAADRPAGTYVHRSGDKKDFLARLDQAIGDFDAGTVPRAMIAGQGKAKDIATFLADRLVRDGNADR